jgi:hypothetical protein
MLVLAPDIGSVFIQWIVDLFHGFPRGDPVGSFQTDIGLSGFWFLSVLLRDALDIGNSYPVLLRIYWINTVKLLILFIVFYLFRLIASNRRLNSLILL